jgi:hypothetical protein
VAKLELYGLFGSFMRNINLVSAVLIIIGFKLYGDYCKNANLQTIKLAEDE